MSGRVFGMLEAAALLGVDRRTLLRWIKAGHLPAQSTAGGQHRIAMADLVRLMTERGIPVPKDLDAPAPVALVVEDDALVARAIVAVVQVLAPHLDVRCARDGFEAGWMIMALHPRVVLLDLGLPGVDGVEVIRRVRSAPEVASTAIIVVTGKLTDAQRSALSALDVAAILMKPLAIEALRDAFAAARVLAPGR